MTSTDKDAEQTHAQHWQHIEREHFGTCAWQSILEGRTIMVESLDYPKAKTMAIVVKHFETSIPRSGSSKPWPKHVASYIYLPVDDSNTWGGLDKFLNELEAKHQTKEVCAG